MVKIILDDDGHKRIIPTIFMQTYLYSMHCIISINTLEALSLFRALKLAQLVCKGFAYFGIQKFSSNCNTFCVALTNSNII